MATDTRHEITFSFADSSYKALEELSKSQGKSMGETLRDAIALTKYIHDTKKSGGEIIIEKNGKTYDLLTP